MPYLYPTSNENKVNEEVRKHRELFGKPVYYSHLGNKVKCTRSTYEFIFHELRYRRFLIMRKYNFRVFAWSVITESLLDHVLLTCDGYREYYSETYNHLLREIQDGKKPGIWGVTYYGMKSQESKK